ncbi:MAG TPA: FAD-dependent oxidoreductase [Polyangiaceae bacterium]|nr:FAD-dependent oxidoreductase [Polyangiaceae bacterium]
MKISRQESSSAPLIEAGEAFRRLGAQAISTQPERFDVIVIGAGQSGLSVGYYLQRLGQRFVILDAQRRVGDRWRQRWDSLRLFTPAKFAGLVGMRFPAPANSFPTKDEMADYLEAYRARFELPVRSGVCVDRLYERDGVYVVHIGGRELEAKQVVVAMGSYQEPRIPSFASELRADIVQVHSSRYVNPTQIRDGAVLVAGAGNSGAEIALELARDHQIWLAGRSTGEIPFRIDGWAARVFLARFVLRFVFHRLLTSKTVIGRRARARLTTQGAPLIRIKSTALSALGVERVPRVTAVRDGLPVLDDGRVLDAANVIWCTGFHPGFSWIDLPVFDEQGHPVHESGVVRASPGLYFVGLHFLHGFSSGMIHGVARDAERISRAIAATARAR